MNTGEGSVLNPRRMKGAVGFYLLLQLVFFGAYLFLAATLLDKLPDTIAVHFESSGTPDIFSDRLWGMLELPALVWLLPFALTLLAKKLRILPADAHLPGENKSLGGAHDPDERRSHRCDVHRGALQCGTHFRKGRQLRGGSPYSRRSHRDLPPDYGWCGWTGMSSSESSGRSSLASV
ncbi:DUF1648 domain-containing protein [Thermococcus sp. JdF3]|nr:DUF1648 domain-containing protein [Thermococcus sp. JdF3]